MKIKVNFKEIIEMLYCFSGGTIVFVLIMLFPNKWALVIPLFLGLFVFFIRINLSKFKLKETLKDGK